jgi:hypothetical protein
MRKRRSDPYGSGLLWRVRQMIRSFLPHGPSAGPFQQNGGLHIPSIGPSGEPDTVVIRPPCHTAGLIMHSSKINTPAAPRLFSCPAIRQ